MLKQCKNIAKNIQKTIQKQYKKQRIYREREIVGAPFHVKALELVIKSSTGGGEVCKNVRLLWAAKKVLHGWVLAAGARINSQSVEDLITNSNALTFYLFFLLSFLYSSLFFLHSSFFFLLYFFKE